MTDKTPAMSKTDELREAIALDDMYVSDESTGDEFTHAWYAHQEKYGRAPDDVILEAARSELSRQQSAQRDSSGPLCYECAESGVPYKSTHEPVSGDCAKCGRKGLLTDRIMQTDTAQSTGAGVEEICMKVAKRVEKQFGSTLMYDASPILREEIVDYLASQKLIGGGWKPERPECAKPLYKHPSGAFRDDQKPEGFRVVNNIFAAESYGELRCAVIARTYAEADYYANLIVAADSLPSPPASTVKRGE